MHYLSKILLLCCLANSTQVLAYDSAADIVITRKSPVQKALLDRKFIFMQEASSVKSSSPSTAKTLNLVSAPVHKPISKVQTISPAIKTKQTSNSDNWDNYAEEVEVDESLDVAAKLIKS